MGLHIFMGHLFLEFLYFTALIFIKEQNSGILMPLLPISKAMRPSIATEH